MGAARRLGDLPARARGKHWFTPRLPALVGVVCAAWPGLVGCELKQQAPDAMTAPQATVTATVSAAVDLNAQGETVLGNTTAVPRRETAEPSACPDGMNLVEGDYCPEVRHRCLRWLDHHGKFARYRCAEYARPAECLSEERVSMRFCIDETEYTRPGESLPANHQSWTDGKRTCESLGKRLCMESEYNFACEGEEMRPYPYGFERDPRACNADKMDIVDDRGKLKDLRAPSESHPRCASPFGVRHLAGNLEEFVTRDGTRPPWPAMKGAYWQPSKNFCRAAQTAHDHHYHGTETGFRCCADVDADADAAAAQP